MAEEPFITIRRRVGNFNFADPSETSSRVRVEIPKYGFEHTFKFGENFPHVEDMGWMEALHQITSERTQLMRDREPQELLEEIMVEHDEEIREEWKEHRERQIEDQIESLKEEQQSL